MSQLSNCESDKKQYIAYEESPDDNNGEIFLDNFRKEQKEIIKPVRILCHSVPVGLVNLTSDSCRRVLYASSHFPIIYHVDENKQQILEGHQASITSLTSSEDKNWIASADSGPQSNIIVWDSRTFNAVRTIFDPHPEGTIAISLSSDARYLVSLSASNDPQEIKVWDWTTGSSEAICISKFYQNKSVNQKNISFAPHNNPLLISNNEQSVFFHKWDTAGNIETYKGQLNAFTAAKIGKITQAIFFPNSNIALSSTSNGYLTVWKESASSLSIFSSQHYFIR
ncbi:Cilia- and flagella-associated protein 251 [Cichlidogyrus casuarinus]|uniref:Cilia- and flagella-associated protein 251 n=1 Tax=Cichlidogyrus casuarinus TaxID=1844966 RepID=A0ABD2QAR9_9PLAT